MKNDDIIYEIKDLFGSIKESDKHDWAKCVMKIKWGDNPTTLDIRNVNLSKNKMGKGISLSDEEADKLVSLLLENDYGTINELEAALNKKKSFFRNTSDDDNLYIIEVFK